MRTRTGAIALLATLSGATGAGRSAMAQSQSSGAGGLGRGAPLQLGVSVAPDTVAVGRPFRVLVRVRAPRGADIAFPPGPDAGGAVEAVDPRVTSTLPDSTLVDRTARYRLAAWDLGRQAFSFAPVAVRIGGEARTLALGDLSVMVVATTPTQATARVPRPERPLFADRPPWWWPWALGALLAVSVLLAWLVLRWWRRRRGRAPASPDAFTLAEAEFASLDRLGLLDAGERGRYVALLVEVVRRYLARRVAAPLALTSAELLEALRLDQRVPLERLRSLLENGDFIKFAQRGVSAEAARTLATEARSLIAATDRMVRAADAAAAHAAGAGGAPPGVTPPARRRAA